MKKIIYLLLVLTLTACIFSSCKSKSEFTYEKVDGGISITGYTGENVNVVIPEKIGKKTVVAIGKSAFDMSKVQIVEIPDSVKTIEEYAFRRCGSLISIKLPNGLKEIKSGTFNFCSLLVDIEIPDSVEIIGDNSFGGTPITTLELSDNVKKIEDYAFYNCVGLKKFVAGKNLEEIGANAFASCISLKEVTLNEGLKSIGENCFNSCQSLTNLEVPSTVDKLPMGVFTHTAFVDFTVSSGIKVIESLAFEGCKSLQNIYIPPTVEEMKTDIFNECRGVTIHGVPDSEAEIYADEKGFKFEKHDFN